MDKRAEYQQELNKLTEIFAGVEPAKAQLVHGLIQDAAFLYVENQSLRELLTQTGMVKVHPQNPEIQKTVEAARQYLKNANSYAVVIKTLNSIMQKDTIEGEDPFDEFLRAEKS